MHDAATKCRPLPNSPVSRFGDEQYGVDIMVVREIKELVGYYGLLADRVLDIVMVEASQIQPVPQVLSSL